MARSWEPLGGDWRRRKFVARPERKREFARHFVTQPDETSESLHLSVIFSANQEGHLSWGSERIHHQFTLGPPFYWLVLILSILYMDLVIIYNHDIYLTSELGLNIAKKVSLFIQWRTLQSLSLQTPSFL